MNVIFSSEDRSETLQLPITPENLEVDFPHNNETFSTIDSGDINLVGRPGLKSIQLDTWLPMKPYSFVKSNVLAPEGKEFFVKYKRERKPLRVVIYNDSGYTFHNELYVIESFVFGFDRVGDMTISLSLKQYVYKRVSL